MRNSDYYIPAIALGIAFAAKLPALRRDPRDPLVRSVLFLLLTGAACFLFAAPPTIAEVNRITGVPNVSAPLVYCVLGTFSCACLVLIVNWRGGPAERVRRSSRRWITVYGAVVAALPVLFVLGDAPEERLRDLDTFYANTPYIREMIVTYLVVHIASAAVTTVMCLRWARAVAQWLRFGLLVLVLGLVLNLFFGLFKLAAVVARWTGRDWDALSTSIAPPTASLGGMIITVGFLLPLLGPRLTGVRRGWRTYTRLGALARHLRAAPGPHSPLPRIPWWAPAGLRLTVRETVIHDELLRLQPYLDDRVRRRALEAALAGGAPDARARDAGVAAMVAAAVAARGGGRPPPEEDEHVQAGARELTAALTPGRDRLVRLSLALNPARFAGSVRRSGPRGREPGARAPAGGSGEVAPAPDRARPPTAHGPVVPPSAPGPIAPAAAPGPVVLPPAPDSAFPPTGPDPGLPPPAPGPGPGLPAAAPGTSPALPPPAPGSGPLLPPPVPGPGPSPAAPGPVPSQNAETPAL
ncbi:MAB_1171c family putative transporter [Streptomyces sp. NPDC020141]|uniref:MAB_1171c family putative transporter n=1 Tax=Streptomyces sp. NPDC020141 TaxID=3365065 RepID=UPI00378BF889